MSALDIYRATKQRLADYKLFSPQTIEAVACVAEQQSLHTKYEDFFAEIEVGKSQLYELAKKQGVPVVEIPAKTKAVGTIVVHLPMSNPLDENQLYHVATAAAALPNYRFIIFGNPSGAPYYFKQQSGTLKGKFAIAFTQHRRVLVAAEIAYLRSKKITQAHHVGYSYGAHKALIECEYLREDEVASITCIDPVSHPRNIVRLVQDFKRSFAPMAAYVERTKIQTYFDARNKTSQTRHHDKALRRPIVIALGVLMARFDFIPQLKRLMASRQSLRVTVAWGSKSELANDAKMSAGLNQLILDTPERIKTLRLKDDAHALGNDVHLYAAIIYESIRGS